MRRLALLLVTCLLPATAASAAPATPTLLGMGDKPWVFVDREGVTHVTWETASGQNSELHYRRRPSGAAAFEADRVLPTPEGPAFTSAFVVQDPAPSSRLVMVVARAPRVTALPGTYAFASTDSGATWAPQPPTAIYSGGPSVNPTDGPVSLAANGGTQGLYVMNGNPNIRVALVPPALSSLVQTETQLTPDKPYNGSVVIDPTGQPVFAYSTLTQWFVRAGIAGTDIPAAPQYERFETIKIAGGPRGVGVMTSGGSVLQTQLDVRLVQGGGFTAPVRVNAAGDNPRQPFIAADATGRFHVAWFSAARNGIIYRRSENGVSWTPPAPVSGGGPNSGTIGYFGLVIGAGPDGSGWAVWQEGSGGSFRILAAPLTTVVDDPSVPDTTGIVNPQVIRNGSGILIAPKRLSLAAARKRKCVLVRVQTTKPARIGVAIFSGTKSIRVFGQVTVRFTKPGKKTVCIPVPLRANTFDIRRNYKYAFAIQNGARPKKGERAPREVRKVFRFLP